jgi:nitronate monooxygenase
VLWCAGLRFRTSHVNALLQRLGLAHPIIQAPMAGTSTVTMAAAASNAGALGSLALGASTVAQAREAWRNCMHSPTNPSDQRQCLLPSTGRAGCRPRCGLAQHLQGHLDEFGGSIRPCP